MSLFTVIAEAAPAAAPAAAPQGSAGGGLMQMVPIFLVFGVMIFFMMRSQKKQQQKRQQMLDQVAKGTKVLLSSGIVGTISAVKENGYLVEIADGVRVEVVKNGIADIVSAEVPAADAK